MSERNPWRTGVIVLSVLIVAVVGVVVLVVVGFLRFFDTPARDGFAVSAVVCEMGPTDETVLVQLTIAATQDVTDGFRFDRPATNDLSIDGVATLTDGASLHSTDVDAVDLRDQLDGSDRFARVSADPVNVVVELRRAGQSVTDARLDDLRLRWGGGESAYIQDVRVGLQLSPASCTVSPR